MFPGTVPSVTLPMSPRTAVVYLGLQLGVFATMLFVVWLCKGL